MLKLLTNQIPTWTIGWGNKEFKFDKIIGAILSIYVDGSEVTWYSFNNNTITLDVAPTSTIVVNYFYREVSWIKWEWLVTLWDLKRAFYRKIGRVNQDGTVPLNLNKLYPEDYVKSELRKSYKRIVNKSPEKLRIQQYALKWVNWYKVIWETSNNTITFDQSLSQEIEGIFFVWDGVVYDYYSVDNWVFQVKDVDISEIGDRVIVWNRIPYGVQKISSVYVDWVELDYIDERDFNMATVDKYTITRDWQGNKYIILPYSENEEVTVVKFIAEVDAMSDEDDAIDIPEEYMDVIVYDTAYRLLMDKEDERWMWMKQELWNGRKEWLLYEYQAFVKSETKNSRAKIWIARTYKDYQY